MLLIIAYLVFGGIPGINGTQIAQITQISFFLKCDELSGEDIRGGA